MYSFLVILKFLLGYKYKLQLTQNLRKYEREKERERESGHIILLLRGLLAYKKKEKMKKNKKN